ncbi:hypothetical protein [Hyphomicrobium sulfonivorans]|uniref:hypothetical protein n=2 Tax=Hyphomicrobium sulfonivorans TaxID=121290 RepID=UPI001FEF408E|nr:hypothetical protein [Hyphomicrobium sulfonivorans]
MSKPNDTAPGVQPMATAEVIPMSEPFGGPGKRQEVETLIRRVADTLHRLNEQIEAAVKAGATVELMRRSRIHNGSGQWGDQMIPIIRMAEQNDRKD